ncbi:ATP-binding protein [Maribellus luteus]|uniref:ATP-binding protein n=1 Tax=Maribellus luteus TaxID=2305463 RepID=A0A399T692_9BACT|nr:ATP-binding protein [Maribellus luteus]RIJ50504.1 ATP-binding protein [Maribellus luteus]
MTVKSINAAFIEQELQWFQDLIMLRGKITFERSASETAITNLPLPSADKYPCPYTDLIKKHSMRMEERLILILALIPHIKPSLLDLLYMKNELYDIPFTEFGGVRNENFKGYLPTGETALFLLAGHDLGKRFDLLHLLDKEHYLRKHDIINLEKKSSNAPMASGLLSVTPEYLFYCTTGEKYKPDFNADFPAKRITTSQEWSDLVLPGNLLQGLEEIKDYIEHGKDLKNNFSFGKKIKPGFKVLFTGPPGTGKTLTASLLGKQFNMDVYKVDLSMVVSKYVGETEKNLSRIFDLAESKDWILFFDEADALFGKRSNTSDSHDRYANQEVSFLLQRMEDYDGLVILCSNFKKNIDEAFFRRFQLILDFEIPDVYLRHQLWEKSTTSDFTYDEDINIDLLAEQHELSAASIINVLHYCILKCMRRKDKLIRWQDIQAGLKMEKMKEGKSIV